VVGKPSRYSQPATGSSMDGSRVCCGRGAPNTAKVGLLQAQVDGSMMVRIFDGNDDAYQAWVVAHPAGFVLNARRSLSPGYMVLHRSTCRSVRYYNPTAPRGAFTERGYVKICATDLVDLKHWARKHGRLNGSFSKVCSLCS
jgi:hypothetical protein